jgi:hypothetical protein
MKMGNERMSATTALAVVRGSASAAKVKAETDLQLTLSRSSVKRDTVLTYLSCFMFFNLVT